jgi:2-polyprenyl-6-methoxyphenol hydroxylase-like FAD-dependent oxidoreductase
MESLRTNCCVVGGGPAGVMLGYLLARAGIKVTVLEKHQDFFRDFRGDTVHPSTLDIMHELGLLNGLLQLPHQRVTSVSARVGDFNFDAADFRHVPTRCKFVALMPQWDFLNFLAEHARRFAGFELRMQHEGTGLIRDGQRIAGVEARSPAGPLQIEADLVIACDGRHSTMRQAAQLSVQEFGVPIDVLWFRISRHPHDPHQVLGNINYGKALVLINRGDYFQAGLIIRKGTFERIKAEGLDAFRRNIGQIAPYLRDRAGEIEAWDQLKLLTVQINRLRRWHRPGLLCIGDAAHAMSPAGGVGINLAIQDAVAAANILAGPLRDGQVTGSVLQRVQQRREFPTRVTQFLQVNAHKALNAAFQTDGPIHAPWQLKAVDALPGRKWVMGYVVGVGVRPEHVAAASGMRRRWSLQKAAARVGAVIGMIVKAVHFAGIPRDICSDTVSTG